MRIHTLKHQIWLYEDTSLWRRVKKELGIILIFIALALALALIGLSSQARLEKYRTESKTFVLTPLNL